MLRPEPIISLLALTVLAGCGGSGGEPPAPAPQTVGGARLLTAYAFTLSDAGSEADRLVARSDFGATDVVDVVIDFRIEPTRGRYDYSSGTVSFTDGAIAVESDFGFIVVDIVDPVVLAPGAAPREVAIELDITIEGHARLQFGSGTVDLVRGSAPPITLTVAALEDLLAARLTTPVWQHQSALAWAALDLLRHLVVATANTFTLIGEPLETAVSIDTSCELMPATPPAGFPNQGLSRLTWLGAGSIRTGDDFIAEYMGCWQAGPAGRGVLLDGSVRYRGLFATVGGGTFSQIGFRTTGVTLGGVLPESLTIAATRRPAAAALDLPPHLRFELGNGLRLTFAAP